MTKWPCKDCICIPICRNKRIAVAIEECELIRDLLYENFPNPGNKSPTFRSFIEKQMEIKEFLGSRT